MTLVKGVSYEELVERAEALDAFVPEEWAELDRINTELFDAGYRIDELPDGWRWAEWKGLR